MLETIILNMTRVVSIRAIVSSIKVPMQIKVSISWQIRQTEASIQLLIIPTKPSPETIPMIVSNKSSIP